MASAHPQSAATSKPPANPAELAERIHALDPSAFFVAPRVLRRVIVHDCLLTSLSIQAPDHPCYVIGHDALLDLVARDELQPGPRPVPELVMLLEAFDDEAFATRPHAEIFLDAQRMLLHARVHAAYHKLIEDRAFQPHLVKQRVDELGQAEFDEIRLVQRQDDLVLPPRGERENFIEFVAHFLELNFFDPAGISICYPLLEDQRQHVLNVIAQDIDLEACLTGLDVIEDDESAKPSISAGAATPSTNGRAASNEIAQEQSLGAKDDAASDSNAGLSERKARRLLRRAERAEKVGNNVRAAICYHRLSHVSQPGVPEDANELALANIKTLRERLQTAIGFDDAEAAQWDAGLQALLFATDQHIWPIEARLLYDLQKVCVDTEREIFTVDLSGWMAAWWNRSLLFCGRLLLSFSMLVWAGVLFVWQRGVRRSREESPEDEALSDGDAVSQNGRPRRCFRYPAIPPIRRSLPAQREVLMCKHLRSAEKRLAPARIDENTRLDLVRLVHSATRAAETAMRDKLRGRLVAVFDRLGIRGRNLPERVSRKKLIEELLDQITRRGYLSIGDLRDAIARNRAKLPDLIDLREFLAGDQLLQLNRRLSRSLDGVYRPAEVYLRWLQRISSLAFANRVGRFLTRFVALPFGGAYVILAGLQHFLPHDADAENANEATLASPTMVFLLGAVFLAIINSRRVRAVIVRANRLFRRGLSLLVALLVEALGLPIVRKILRSQGFRWFARWLAKPLLVTVGVCLVLLLAGVSAGVLGWVAVGTFIVANVSLNTRSGRDLEEMTSEYFVRGWRNFRIVVLTGLFRWIVDWSRRVLNAIDRALYTADEWLRFRRGESRLTLIAKAVVGFVWSIVRYVVRFGINLLLEPQINPIKHFPIVTVSHKLLFALLEPTARLLSNATTYTYAEALFFVGSVIWLIPGIFGFMAWELKENWRLYRANLPERLKPVIVGHHGENMVRMLKPGFHSGTIPKAFKKLRRARRKAILRKDPALLRKAQEPLAEARHLIHDFFQREVLQLLEDCGAWPHSVSLSEVRLATNRMELELQCEKWPDQPAVISLSEQSAKIVAATERTGWINRLEHSERLIIRNALMGFYKLSAVSVIREQIDACFPEHDFHYDINERGLILWPKDDFKTEVEYDLSIGPILHPTLVSGITPASLPTLTMGEIFLNQTPLPWTNWTSYWDDCTRGECPLRRLVSEFRVLPAAESTSSPAEHAIAPL